MSKPLEENDSANRSAYNRRATLDSVALLNKSKLATYVAESTINDNHLDDIRHGAKNEQEFSASFLPASLVPMIRSKADDAAGGAMPSVPFTHQCEAVCMMADISGYTALSRNLCILGPDGVDLLSNELNSFFDRLVTIVHRYGGDIYKFAGDAIICLWLEEKPGIPDGDSQSKMRDILISSIQCSFELVGIEHHLTKVAQAAMAADSDIDISSLTLPDSLGLHCAVGIGPLEMAAIGSPPEFIANGTGFAQVERSLSASVRGELAMSTEAWSYLCQAGVEGAMDWVAVDVAEGVKRLELKVESAGLVFTNTWNSEFEDMDDAMPAPNDEKEEEGDLFSGSSTRSAAFRNLSPELWKTLLTFEPPIILKEHQMDEDRPLTPTRYRKNTNSGHPHEFMVTPQIRSVTILFVNIAPDSAGNLLDLHSPLSSMQEAMLKYNAFLRQFLVDDKGIVLIAALGVPKYAHADDVDRAMALGLDFCQILETFGAKYSIGVSSGLGFCGVVGNNTRQEYAIIGSTVNLAAKIMAKKINQNGMHCDGATRSRVDPSKFSFTEKGAITVKGFDEPVTIYQPKKKMWNLVGRTFTNHAGLTEPTPSRKEPFSKFLKFLDESLAAGGDGKQKNVCALVRGKRHVGRTQFVRDGIRKAGREGYEIFKTAAVSRTSPLSAVAPLLRWLLQLDPSADVEMGRSRFIGLMNQLPEDGADEDVKHTLLRLLLKQTSDGRPSLNRTPSLNSSMDSSARSVASKGEKTAALDAAEVAVQLVALVLEKSGARFKDSVAIIVVEEVQLLDDVSRRLLKLMVQGTYSVKMHFIFTATEVDDSRLIQDFIFDHDVELHALTRDDTHHILKREYGTEHALEEETVDLIAASAGGEPYWIVELGKLTKRAGNHAIQSEEALTKVTLERFDHLSELQQDILQQCAVMAVVDEGTCSLSLAVKLASEPEVALEIMQTDLFHTEEMATFLRGARRKNAGDEAHDMGHGETFRFNHAFTARTIYDLIPRAERLLAHEKVATAIILESLTGAEIEMKHELETIATHFELGLCHDQFNRYLALAVAETMATGTAADLHALVTPFLGRFVHHHDPREAYGVLLRALELGREKMVAKRSETTRSLKRVSSFRSVAREKHVIEVAESEIKETDMLIKTVSAAVDARRGLEEEDVEVRSPSAVNLSETDDSPEPSKAAPKLCCAMM